MTNFQRVAVLLGGRSAEREVSLVSRPRLRPGAARRRFRVIEIDAKDDVAQQLIGRTSPTPCSMRCMAAGAKTVACRVCWN